MSTDAVPCSKPGLLKAWFRNEVFVDASFLSQGFCSSVDDVLTKIRWSSEKVNKIRKRIGGCEKT